jgi:hypothetical protein
MASEKIVKPRRPPATTVEARENQLSAAAYDLAEKQISAGTASSQVITYFLKVGATREQLELERLRNENRLLESRADQIDSGARVEELYGAAITAMRGYNGQGEV